MKRREIAMALATKSVPQLILFIRHVVEKMTGNPNFINPAPALSVLADSANALEKAQQNKKVLGTANRNEKRRQAEKLLNKIAVYITLESEGDGAIMESAGMPLKREGTPRSLPGEVRNLKIKDGVERGEVIVSHRGAGGRNNLYRTEYSLDPLMRPNSWVMMPPTGQLRIVIKGLPSGRRVAFRVRVNNTAGLGPYSTVVFRTIQ